MSSSTKPILKWVGGKTQIIDKITSHFPTQIANYHELFLGGGSVLFALLECRAKELVRVSGTIYAYDLNDPLIHVYKNIQSNHVALYEKIQELVSEYNSCVSGPVNRKPTNLEEAKQNGENYYYWSRARYNSLSVDQKRTVEGSALFIFLNKTCFRGLFRVGPNGFNVPYGNYKKPEIINRDHLDRVHQLIQGVVFECCDFAVAMPRIIGAGDYAYLDPPYAPETDTSFVKYTDAGFALEKHAQLFTLCKALPCKWTMSNADVALVRQHFAEDVYKIESISCRRAINSAKPESTTMEVIICAVQKTYS